MAEELDSGGNLVTHFTQGAGIDEALALTGTGGTYFYHADGLGSITSLTDSTGNLSASYVYDSFGQLTASTGSITNPFHYTGREFDAETGLYDYRARYDDPSSGRFISEDPVRFDQGGNFYTYVSSHPTDLMDPTGLTKCCPSRYENEIEKGIKNARDRLDHLEMFGTAILPSDGARVTVGGITGCNSGSRILGTNITVPDQYNMQIDVDPDKHPCDYECAVAHENVHARMCRKMGGTRFNALTEAEREIPAYTMELGCFLKMLRDNNLGPYKK